MERIPDALLERMAGLLARDDRDEMAIPSYRHPNPALRWMAWRRVEVLAAHLERTCADGRRDRTILDFGCGTGVLFREAARWAGRIYGVDPVLDAARLLVATYGLEEQVTLLDPAALPATVPEAGVDVILAAEVLEHVDPLPPTLRLLRSRLRPDGRLLVSLPTEGALYRLGRRLAGFSGEYHHHAAAGIHTMILEQGFRLERLRKIPAPGPFAIYWVADYAPA